MIEAELLARLRANPRDDETRAVYADCLEEQGLVHRAAFLRATELGARHAIAIAHPGDAAWRAVVTRQPLARCASMYRQGCAIPWEHHATTDDDLERRCATCRRTVFYCATLEELVRLGSTAARCIAIDLALDEAVAKDRYDAVRPSDSPSPYRDASRYVELKPSSK